MSSYVETHHVPESTVEMALNINPVTATVVENMVHNLAYEAYQGLGRQNLQIDGKSSSRVFMSMEGSPVSGQGSTF